MKLVWPLLVMLLLTASPASSQVPDDALIMPGLRIGRWTLEMSLDDLLRVNGQGGSVALSNPAYVGGLIVIAWPTNPLAAFTRDRRRIEALSIEAGAFRTDKGIGIGSSRANVIAAYGNSTATVAISPTTVLMYDEIGASFGVDNDRISRIWIFRARTGVSIWRYQATAPAPVPAPTPTPGGRDGY
jgi:hypothetical protein